MILGLLTLCSLSYWNCKTRVTVEPVLIGETRIVGKITDGKIVWEPKETGAGKYYIVTPAFVKTTIGLAMENAELRKAIEKLIAKGNDK